MTTCSKCSAFEFLSLQFMVQTVILASKGNRWLAYSLTSQKPQACGKEKASPVDSS